MPEIKGWPVYVPGEKPEKCAKCAKYINAETDPAPWPFVDENGKQQLLCHECHTKDHNVFARLRGKKKTPWPQKVSP